MIVCSCNVLSDHDVRAVIGAEQMPRSTGQVYGCLGCSAQCGRRDRVVHDAADGARATAALGAAAEAAIDLPGGSWRLLGADHRAHVVVAQHVAGADDHGAWLSQAGLVRYATIDT